MYVCVSQNFWNVSIFFPPNILWIDKYLTWGCFWPSPAPISTFFCATYEGKRENFFSFYWTYVCVRAILTFSLSFLWTFPLVDLHHATGQHHLAFGGVQISSFFVLCAATAACSTAAPWLLLLPFSNGREAEHQPARLSFEDKIGGRLFVFRPRSERRAWICNEGRFCRRERIFICGGGV